MSTSSDSLILDFFAGSWTTAQAVLELNARDGGNRRFILVQLAEPTNRKDFATIADITKERVRRVIKKLEAELAAKSAESTRRAAGELPLEDSAFTTWWSMNPRWNTSSPGRSMPGEASP